MARRPSHRPFATDVLSAPFSACSTLRRIRDLSPPASPRFSPCVLIRAEQRKAERRGPRGRWWRASTRGRRTGSCSTPRRRCPSHGSSGPSARCGGPTPRWRRSDLSAGAPRFSLLRLIFGAWMGLRSLDGPRGAYACMHVCGLDRVSLQGSNSCLHKRGFLGAAGVFGRSQLQQQRRAAIAGQFHGCEGNRPALPIPLSPSVWFRRMPGSPFVTLRALLSHLDLPFCSSAPSF